MNTTQTHNETTSRLDELFALAEETRRAYANDETTLTPVALFVNAFRRFYEELTYRPSDRYEGALRFLKELNGIVGELEADEDAPNAWRLWENALRAVDAYDRRERARMTPPQFSIDELLEQGVGKRQIALIYGFVDDRGEPDIARVDARDEWRPRTAANAEPTEPETETNAEPETPTQEATGATPTTTGDAPEPDATPTVDYVAIDAKIAGGVPIRQIAAEHGLEIGEIKERVGTGRRGRPRKES